ncbi:MAG: aminomethyl-transferring glycine dehydrogenase subunit GcvPA [Deltaproteobacteria bacterium]|nr:aminomethyl-transferring glycine dehydrogenase subunit GcvPA [Deltaproteobacteria bacterium]
MTFTPHTPDDVRRMLTAIGVPSTAALFSGIPEKLRLNRPLALPPPVSEPEILRELERLAAANATSATHISFLGGGAYRHFTPAAVDYLVSRGEFATAYTPYQAEISQGTLQAIFEFQTMICQLTGMEAANASMYDGASAAAEAALMAARLTKRKKILVAAGLHPEYRETVDCYCRFLDLEVATLSLGSSGRSEAAALETLADDQTAAVLIGSPNFFGAIEDLAAFAAAVHEKGAKLIVAVAEALSLALLKPPGDFGADMVVGDVQSFGIAPAFGGPHCGFFAVRDKDLRSVPGRLVGETVDQEGQRGFVLTLSTREQHIRREKATSNICSNHGLCALTAAVYLSLMGKEGLRRVAIHNHSKAEYAKKGIAALPGYSLPYAAPTFNEFVVEAPETAALLLKRLQEKGILAGIPLARFFPEQENRLLVCVTEENSRQEIDTLIAALAGGES